MKWDFLFSREEIADLAHALDCAIKDGAASTYEQESRWRALQKRLEEREAMEGKDPWEHEKL